MGGRYRAIDRYLLPTGLTAANLQQWVCCCGMNGPTNARKMHRPCSLSRRTVLIFTARCYASAVLAMALCPSVRPSVTSRCSTKTAKRRITQTTPHDTPGNLVYCRQRSPWNSTGVTPLRGRQTQVGWVKIGDFRQITGYISKTVQDRHTVSIKVE